MVDILGNAIGSLRTTEDIRKEKQLFDLIKAQKQAEIIEAQRKASNPISGVQMPAAIQIADEIAKARQSGDVQRLNDIAAAAKLYDRGVGYSNEGGFEAMGGYGDALSGLRSQVKMAEEQRKLQAKAENALPAAENVFQKSIDTTNELLNDPNLGDVTGFIRGGGAFGIPFTGGKNAIVSGAPAAAIQAKIDQLSGQSFLQALESMRGTGQITEKEGIEGKAAVARLQQSQSDADFRKALQDYQKTVANIYAAAQQRAGQAPTAIDELKRLTNNQPWNIPENTYGANPNAPLTSDMINNQTQKKESLIEKGRRSFKEKRRFEDVLKQYSGE